MRACLAVEFKLYWKKGSVAGSARLLTSSACARFRALHFPPVADFSRRTPMKAGWIVAAALAILAMPVAAGAQGIVGGAQQGAAQGQQQGSKAAGPVGGAVGTVVGGTVGGVTGGVKGALGIPASSQGKTKKQGQQ
jgi:hypothetical protein